MGEAVQHLFAFAEMCIRDSIGADESFLKDRLVDRKMKGGLSLEEATKFCERSDCRNVRRLMRAHQMANTNLMLQADGTYRV